jgi:hypothetical protein
MEERSIVMNEDGVRERADEGGGRMSLNSQCGVCCAPASEYKHYGAISCFSCRWETVIFTHKKCYQPLF